MVVRGVCSRYSRTSIESQSNLCNIHGIKRTPADLGANILSPSASTVMTTRLRFLCNNMRNERFLSIKPRIHVRYMAMKCGTNDFKGSNAQCMCPRYNRRPLEDSLHWHTLHEISRHTLVSKRLFISAVSTFYQRRRHYLSSILPHTVMHRPH